MNRNAVTEADIIDMLLGQATSDRQRDVELAIRSSMELAAIYDEWRKILPAVRQESVRARAVSQDVRQRVMTRLTQEAVAHRATSYERLDVTRVTFFAKRKSALLVAATLVGAFAIIGYSLLGILPRNGKASQGVQDKITYVEFSTGSVTDQLGTEDRPFRTLGGAIAAGSLGGTIRIKADPDCSTSNETLRIALPVRIESARGSVRVGEG